MGFIWFWIVAVMLTAYVVLDGFDLGVGIVYPFLRGPKRERQSCSGASARYGTAMKSG